MLGCRPFCSGRQHAHISQHYRMHMANTHPIIAGCTCCRKQASLHSWASVECVAHVVAAGPALGHRRSRCTVKVAATPRTVCTASSTPTSQPRPDVPLVARRALLSAGAVYGEL